MVMDICESYLWKCFEAGMIFKSRNNFQKAIKLHYSGFEVNISIPWILNWNISRIQAKFWELYVLINEETE